MFKNKLNTLSTKLYTKPTDRPAYLHQKSYHPKSLKDNIPFGQALRVKRICREVEDLDQALSELKGKFLQRGYKEYAVSEQIEKVKSIERKEILTKKKTKKSSKIHFPVPYNTNLPTIKKAIDKNWNILSINREMSDIFNEKPIISFKRNKNLRELIGQVHLKNDKPIKPGRRNISKGYCKPCLTRMNNLCCKQITSTSVYTSELTGKSFNIRHKLNCHSTWLIYLGYCILCAKHQYVGKAEGPFNGRLNNHRNDAKKSKSIPFDEHFQLPNHNFTDHARFILIEQINDKSKGKLQMREILRQRENFWMKKLGTLTPHGLNVQLN